MWPEGVWSGMNYNSRHPYLKWQWQYINQCYAETLPKIWPNQLTTRLGVQAVPGHCAPWVVPSLSPRCKLQVKGQTIFPSFSTQLRNVKQLRQLDGISPTARARRWRSLKLNPDQCHFQAPDCLPYWAILVLRVAALPPADLDYMLQFMDHNQDRDMEGVEEQVLRSLVSILLLSLASPFIRWLNGSERTGVRPSWARIFCGGLTASLMSTLLSIG